MKIPSQTENSLEKSFLSDVRLSSSSLLFMLWETTSSAFDVSFLPELEAQMEVQSCLYKFLNYKEICTPIQLLQD